MIAPSPVDASELPLAGIRVVEFCQMVMGPSCGMILADLGADVVKVEPLAGDRTRRLGGLAAGFFATFSRNKRSVALDTTTPEGQTVARRLVGASDVLIENFRPGLMARFGLDYATLAPVLPRLIYCSLKGFLPGPYEKRTALDEVVQMMGGLAYMTGPPGKPMRAGASVNDIMGGMFGVIAIQAALAARERTGRGQHIQSALFENNVFLMGQAMMFQAVTGRPVQPWSVKDAPWPVYDLFEMQDGSQMFVSIVGEEHWRDFCRSFARPEWLDDPRLATSADRVAARPWLLPEIATLLKARSPAELAATFERLGLPFAPVRGPGELFEDAHLNASGGLLDIVLPDGRPTRIPALPVTLAGHRLPKRLDPPAAAGRDTDAVLRELGFEPEEIDRLVEAGAVGRGADEAGRPQAA
ncbi:MAG: CoA transferase [Methylobacteriaceae bacterium]|nr:CoA transferase [Methylobacteriaceae bacterium]